MITPRMKECLDLVQRGLTNKDIGKALFITEEAAEDLVDKLIKVYDVKSRYELMVRSWRSKGAKHSRTVPVYYVFDAPQGLMISSFEDFDHYFKTGEIECFDIKDEPIINHAGQYVYVLLVNDEMRLIDPECVRLR